MNFRDRRGMTTVEVLLITPFVLFFLLGTVQVLQALVVQSVVTSAAREAARTLAVHHDAALARQRADDVISGTLSTGREGEAQAAEAKVYYRSKIDFTDEGGRTAWWDPSWSAPADHVITRIEFRTAPAYDDYYRDNKRVEGFKDGKWHVIKRYSEGQKHRGYISDAVDVAGRGYTKVRFLFEMYDRAKSASGNPGSSYIRITYEPVIKEGSGVRYSARLMEAEEAGGVVTIPVTVTNTGPGIKPPTHLDYQVKGLKGDVLVHYGVKTPVGGLKTGESRAVGLVVLEEHIAEKAEWIEVDLIKAGRWRASERGSDPLKISVDELNACLELAKQEEQGVQQGQPPEQVYTGEGQLSISEEPKEEKDYDCNFDPERDVKLYDDGVHCTAVVEYHIRTICPALPKLFDPDAAVWARWIDVSGTAVFKREFETP